MDHDRLDLHVYVHHEASDRVAERLDQILHAVAGLATQGKADTKMVSAQIQAFSDRVNTATNEIASDLKALRDKVASGQTLSPEDAALLDAAAARLEAMGVDPENPVPPVAQMLRHDPGPCLICGAPHCRCGGGPILVEQLPASAAAALVGPTAPLVADVVQATLPEGSFTTATYRGKKKKP